MSISINSKQMIKFLKSKGFYHLRSGRHEIYTNGSNIVPILMHNKDIKEGTLHSILQLAGLTKKELKEWLQ